jgi:hypothetical protein
MPTMDYGVLDYGDMNWLCSFLCRTGLLASGRDLVFGYI